MWSYNVRELVEQSASAVAFVEVQDTEGTISVGTAFHIGSGYFATARHVIHGQKIRTIGRRDTSLRTHFTEAGKVIHTTTYPDFQHAEIERVFDHPDEAVDLSLIKLGGIVGNVPAAQLLPILQLYSHADSLSEGEYLMREVVVMGYPPIPFSSDCHLVVFRGEVSAIIENYQDKKRHFVISGMARGGFSGGPVVLAKNPNAVLGVVGKSFVKGASATELGFIGAVSAGAIFETIASHNLSIKAIDLTLQGFMLPPNFTQ